jgi:glucose/arabinose dehydrogenase
MTKDMVHLAVLTAIGGSLLVAIGLLAPAQIVARGAKQVAGLLEGRAAFTDWSADRPGLRRHIRPADLPAADLGASFSNGVRIVHRSSSQKPMVPPGFEVKLFAEGLNEPRLIRAAPDGDIFVAESDPTGFACCGLWMPVSRAARYLRPILRLRSALRSIRLARIRNGSTSPTPIQSCALLIATATSRPTASPKPWCRG